MRVKNIIDLIDKLFYGDYDNVYIVDMDERETKKMSCMTLSELMEYDINKIDGICSELETKNIYIKI